MSSNLISRSTEHRVGCILNRTLFLLYYITKLANDAAADIAIGVICGVPISKKHRSTLLYQNWVWRSRVLGSLRRFGIHLLSTFWSSMSGFFSVKLQIQLDHPAISE